MIDYYEIKYRAIGGRRPMRIVSRLTESKVVEILLTVIVYALYTGVIAVSIAPAAWIALSLLPWALPSGVVATATTAIRLAAVAGIGFYSYVFAGAVFQATLIRILSAGVKPGRYPAISFTTVRWLIYSGIFTISTRSVLPFVPVTFVINMYFRIIGCRMGKNVKLNTFQLNDAYLLTLGDNVIIGGQTDVSCHLFEQNHLLLKRIEIGSDTLIGAHSYISPGVTIGRHCVVGLYSYIRSDRAIPDRTVITSLAGIDIRTARELERGLGLQSSRRGKR
jgi:hypothetical protein